MSMIKKILRVTSPSLSGSNNKGRYKKKERNAAASYAAYTIPKDYKKLLKRLRGNQKVFPKVGPGLMAFIEDKNSIPYTPLPTKLTTKKTPLQSFISDSTKHWGPNKAPGQAGYVRWRVYGAPNPFDEYSQGSHSLELECLVISQYVNKLKRISGHLNVFLLHSLESGILNPRAIEDFRFIATTFKKWSEKLPRPIAMFFMYQSKFPRNSHYLKSDLADFSSFIDKVIGAYTMGRVDQELIHEYYEFLNWFPIKHENEELAKKLENEINYRLSQKTI